LSLVSKQLPRRDAAFLINGYNANTIADTVSSRMICFIGEEVTDNAMSIDTLNESVLLTTEPALVFEDFHDLDNKAGH
jgi:hypothetical protein